MTLEQTFSGENRLFMLSLVTLYPSVQTTSYTKFTLADTFFLG